MPRDRDHKQAAKNRFHFKYSGDPTTKRGHSKLTLVLITEPNNNSLRLPRFSLALTLSSCVAFVYMYMYHIYVQVALEHTLGAHMWMILNIWMKICSKVIRKIKLPPSSSNLQVNITFFVVFCCLLLSLSLFWWVSQDSTLNHII